MKQFHNKLVRDRIPDIIEANGEIAEFRTLTGDELSKLKETKLHEEFAEYLQDKSFEEAADLLEIIISQLEDKNPDMDSETVLETILTALRKKKLYRGGFHKGVLLISTEPKQTSEDP